MIRRRRSSFLFASRSSLGGSNLTRRDFGIVDLLYVLKSTCHFGCQFVFFR